MARDGERLFTCIARNGSTSEFLSLHEDLFDDGRESEIYDFMRTHYEQHGQLPALETIQHETGLNALRTPEPIGFYINKVYDRSCYNGLRELVRPLTDSLRDNDLDNAQTVLAQMRTVTERFTDTRSVVSFREAAQDALDGYMQAHNTIGISGVPTGCPMMDFDTDGWQGGDLIFIVARMGMGKTYFLIKMVLGAYLAGRSALFVSMEMPVRPILRRFLGMMTGINPDFIKRGQLPTPDLNRLQACINEIENSERLSFVSGDMNQRVSDLDALIEDRRPDIVYIDGAYLMSPADKRLTKRVDKMELVVAELKRICNLKDIPIICTSQFNRESKGKGRGGTLETVGYSDAIGTDSSLILAIKPGEGSEEDTVRYLEWLKGREGEHGSHKYNFLFTPMDFSPVIENDDDYDNGEEDEEDFSDWTAE